jgi:hypothetical protein
MLFEVRERHHRWLVVLLRKEHVCAWTILMCSVDRPTYTLTPVLFTVRLTYTHSHTTSSTLG